MKTLLPIFLFLPSTTLPTNEIPIATLLAATLSTDKLPTTIGIFHTMLPYELKVPYVSETTMIELIIQIQVSEGRYLNINNKLSEEQQLQLVELMRSHQHAFAWDYHDMKGLDPKFYTYRIYIRDDCQLVGKPQQRINPALRKTVKTKL